MSESAQPSHSNSKSKQSNSKTQKIKKEYYAYLERSGISIGFQIIFNEIVGKNIKESEVFQYTAKRLRDFKEIVEKNKIREEIDNIK